MPHLTGDENRVLKIALRADIELLQGAIKRNDWDVVKRAAKLLSMEFDDRLVAMSYCHECVKTEELLRQSRQRDDS